MAAVPGRNIMKLAAHMHEEDVSKIFLIIMLCVDVKITHPD